MSVMLTSEAGGWNRNPRMKAQQTHRLDCHDPLVVGASPTPHVVSPADTRTVPATRQRKCLRHQRARGVDGDHYTGPSRTYPADRQPANGSWCRGRHPEGGGWLGAENGYAASFTRGIALAVGLKLRCCTTSPARKASWLHWGG